MRWVGIDPLHSVTLRDRAVGGTADSPIAETQALGLSEAKLEDPGAQKLQLKYNLPPLVLKRVVSWRR